MNPNDSSAPAIVAENLTKVYGSGNTEVVAMRDVSLRVARGEVIALLGPSGAGKSTLLTAIGLINPPTAGRIHIGGELVMDADQAKVDLRGFRRRHLGFVFQKANLIPFLSAIENVQVALEINDTSPRAAHKRAMELLDYLGVADRAGNLPDALSGGQQQRVAVARALGGRPSILLADEPTGNLDSKNAQAVMDLLRELHAEGATICLVTHDERYAHDAQRTIRLFDGKVVEKEVGAAAR